MPLRAKCICDMLVSPVRAASALRRTTQSARGLRISRVGLDAAMEATSLLDGWETLGFADGERRIKTESDYRLLRASRSITKACQGGRGAERGWRWPGRSGPGPVRRTNRRPR